jgi:hypothetical protein
MSVLMLFQWGVIAVWAVIVGSLLALRRRHSESTGVLFTILAITVISPIELLYDQAFALTYSSQLIPLLPNITAPFRELPMMIPFAYGTFYGVPLLVTLAIMRKVEKTSTPLWVSLITMLVGMFGFNLLVEWWTTGAADSVWSYAWSANTFIRFGATGGQPWVVPVTVAVNLPLYYLAHRFARRRGVVLGTLPERFLLHQGAIWIATLIIFVSAIAVLTATGGPH